MKIIYCKQDRKRFIFTFTLHKKTKNKKQCYYTSHNFPNMDTSFIWVVYQLNCLHINVFFFLIYALLLLTSLMDCRHIELDMEFENSYTSLLLSNKIDNWVIPLLAGGTFVTVFIKVTRMERKDILKH